MTYSTQPELAPAFGSRAAQLGRSPADGLFGQTQSELAQPADSKPIRPALDMLGISTHSNGSLSPTSPTSSTSFASGRRSPSTARSSPDLTQHLNGFNMPLSTAGPAPSPPVNPLYQLSAEMTAKARARDAVGQPEVRPSSSSANQPNRAGEFAHLTGLIKQEARHEVQLEHSLSVNSNISSHKEQVPAGQGSHSARRVMVGSDRLSLNSFDSADDPFPKPEQGSAEPPLDSVLVKHKEDDQSFTDQLRMHRAERQAERRTASNSISNGSASPTIKGKERAPNQEVQDALERTLPPGSPPLHQSALGDDQPHSPPLNGRRSPQKELLLPRMAAGRKERDSDRHSPRLSGNANGMIRVPERSPRLNSGFVVTSRKERPPSPEAARIEPRLSPQLTPNSNLKPLKLAGSASPPHQTGSYFASSPPDLKLGPAYVTSPVELVQLEPAEVYKQNGNPPPSSTSLLSVNRGTPPPMRRANTTGSPSLLAPPSPSPPALNSQPSRLSPQRSSSFPLRTDHSSVNADEEGDEVEESIAAQALAIRKARAEKKLEQAMGSGAASGAGIGLGHSTSVSSGAGGAPLKRRSTRLGSQSDGPTGAGVLVGNLIGQDHANYVLMYNMLTGIRIGVSRCQAKMARPITDADYTARHKFSFDIVGNELTPSTKYDFKFKDYAPWIFRDIREFFYLDPSDYLVSLTAKYILSELGSPGKSGSFFYFSRDYRFIIKTIHHSEHKFLRSVLKEYHEYIKANPHTLLSRFYGLHRVKLPRGRKIHFVIMNNLFPPHRDIHETYDLKGSAIGRLYPEEKAAANPRGILKDLNWLGRQRELRLGPEKKALFEEQLKRDTQLMQRLGIMDYSLLTGIHHLAKGNTENVRDGLLTVFQPDTVKLHRTPTQLKRIQAANAVRAAVDRSNPQALDVTANLPGHDSAADRQRFLFYRDEGGLKATGDANEDLDDIYYLGIIDILTPYRCVKRLEHFWKGLQHDKHMISAVPPKEYGDRFLSFIYSIIRGNDKSTRPKMYENGQVPEGAAQGKEQESKAPEVPGAEGPTTKEVE